MTRLFFVIAFIALLVGGIVLYRNTQQTLHTPTTANTQAATSSSVSQSMSNVACRKKGIALGNNPQEIAEMQVAWYYDWKTTPVQGVPNTTSFIPMMWGINSAGAMTQRVPIVLGFNEPNIANQSNISPAQALAAWPQVQKWGIRVGAPAIGGDSTAARAWLTAFMTGAQQQHLRVDFIPIHWYGPPDPATFLSFVDSVHAQFNLPIWITEFAVKDSLNGGATYTPAQVLSFMHAVLPALENRPYVERFSWFAGIGVHPEALTASRLVDSNGNLTPLGQYYASFPETGSVCGQ